MTNSTITTADYETTYPGITPASANVGEPLADVQRGYLIHNGYRVQPIFETLQHCRFQVMATVRMYSHRLANPSSAYDSERREILISTLNNVRKAFDWPFRGVHFAASVEYGKSDLVHFHILYAFHGITLDSDLEEQFCEVLSLEFARHDIEDIHFIRDIVGSKAVISYAFKVERTPREHSFILSHGFAEILANIKAEALAEESRSGIQIDRPINLEMEVAR